MHCSAWLGDDDTILAHSRHAEFADGNYDDNALNSSLCHVSIHE